MDYKVLLAWIVVVAVTSTGIQECQAAPRDMKTFPGVVNQFFMSFNRFFQSMVTPMPSNLSPRLGQPAILPSSASFSSPSVKFQHPGNLQINNPTLRTVANQPKFSHHTPVPPPRPQIGITALDSFSEVDKRIFDMNRKSKNEGSNRIFSRLYENGPIYEYVIKRVRVPFSNYNHFLFSGEEEGNVELKQTKDGEKYYLKEIKVPIRRIRS